LPLESLIDSSLNGSHAHGPSNFATVWLPCRKRNPLTRMAYEPNSTANHHGPIIRAAALPMDARVALSGRQGGQHPPARRAHGCEFALFRAPRSDDIMLKVWGRKTSVNVQKVMWTVAELGIPHERIDAGANFGKLDTPEFGAMNPNRLVPVIDDDGFILWESNAIVRYLSEHYGRGKLAPEGRHGYARADQWMEWSITEIYRDLIGVCFSGHVRVTAKDRDLAGIAAAAKRVGDKLAILDRQLDGRAFICGDQLTMADVAVGTLMYRYYTLPIERPSLGNVEHWYGRLSARGPYKDHAMIDWQAMKIPGA
jgi:glutathione S-transferase